jgi:hypothetical protein
VASVSLHSQIIDAVQAKLITLIGDDGLDGITSGRIVKAWLPDPENLKKFEKLNGLPAIFVCPYGNESMPPNDTTTATDDITYPAPVAIVAANDPDLTLNLDKYLTWREIAIGGFHNKRLSGVDEVMRCVVVPDQVINIPGLATHQYWVSCFRVMATARKSRT